VFSREALVVLHRWTGLIAGVLLLGQGLTGSVVAFRDELNRLLHAEALTVSPAPVAQPVQSLLDQVRAAHPALYVERIEYPQRADEAFVFRLEAAGHKAARYVAVDQYRGEITRDAALAGWPVEWLYRLHQQLLAGKRGEIVVGVTGVALLVLCLSAPFVWWPGRRQLHRGFTVELNGGAYRSLRELHRVGGIFIVLVLLTTSVTGVAIVWKTPLQSAVDRIVPTQSKPVVQVDSRSDRTLLPVDALVTDARQRYENAQVRNVRFPGGHGRVVTIFLATASTTRPRASDQLWYDGYNGEVLGAYEAGSVPAGNRIFDWLLPIHTGEFLGLFGRLLFFAAALALAALTITGLWQWVLRRRLQQAAPPRRQPLRVPAHAIEVTVDRAWNATPRIRAFDLSATDGRELPAFTAGAHIDVYFHDGFVRQYSLWGDPADRSRYRIAVLRAPNSRGGSRAAHALHAGMTLRIGPPRNTFMLEESAPAAVLIAGGIGVTPILSMAAQLSRSARAYTVHYAVRERREAAFAEALSEIAGDAAFAIYASDEHKRLNIREALASSTAGAHVYVCGPERLIKGVLAAATSLGWDRQRVHFELFDAPESDAASEAFELHLARSGRIVHVPARRTALEVLVEQGVPIAASCRTGICGTCATTVLDGVPEHRDRFLTEEERSRNALFTPCCSRARTPVLVVDL
jgi:vanillate O-demethylase ferredoxin subunit